MSFEGRATGAPMRWSLTRTRRSPPRSIALRTRSIPSPEKKAKSKSRTTDERSAVLVSDDEAADLSSVVRDFDFAFFSGDGIDRVRSAIDRGGLRRVRVSDHRIGAPVARPSKLMAVGLNYSDHAKETNATLPEKPIFFDKATTAINGPYDDIV